MIRLKKKYLLFNILEKKYIELEISVSSASVDTSPVFSQKYFFSSKFSTNINFFFIKYKLDGLKRWQLVLKKKKKILKIKPRL